MPLITNASMSFVIGRRGIDNFIMGRCRDTCDLCKKSMFIDLTDVVQSIHVGVSNFTNRIKQREVNDSEWNMNVSKAIKQPFGMPRQQGFYYLEKKEKYELSKYLKKGYLCVCLKCCDYHYFVFLSFFFCIRFQSEGYLY